jgi:hypothetical protein
MRGVQFTSDFQCVFAASCRELQASGLCSPEGIVAAQLERHTRSFTVRGDDVAG